MSNFVHLNVHSSYSFHEGASTVESLVKQAVTLGMTHLALTDTNGMYGIVQFMQLCNKYGITPIPGIEISIPDSSLTNILTNTYRTILLARNIAGYRELCRITTSHQLDQDFTIESALSNVSDNIVIITPNQSLLEQLFSHTVPGQLFGELTPPQNPQNPHSARLLKWCRQHKIPVVATNRVIMAEPQDYHTHIVLQAIGNNSTIDATKGKTTGNINNYLTSQDQMEQAFRNIPDALENTVRIAESCSVDLKLGQLKFPPFDTPNSQSPFDYLKSLANKGLQERYGSDPPSEARSRLTYELGLIDHLGFTEYFLVVHDIAREARSRNIPTIGRGSAANSIVSYCLKMTHVCPLSLNLFFERFLNPERKSPPDIDLDFSWQHRDDIINYVYDRYGHDRVAMISTTVTFQGRSAIHEIAKTMGIPEPEIKAITSKIPSWGTKDLSNLRDKYPECRDLPLDRDPWRFIMQIGQRIIGFPRHLSIHASGIVISPGPITDWTALERSAKGFVITQYDMHPIEDLGLVKIDLLSQRSLGVYRDCVTQIKSQGKPPPPTEDLDAILADEPTLSLVREGRTMGCFYIESPGMQALLKKLGVDTFEMLVAASSVIRPGVSESGMMTQFIERHRDPSIVEYLHPVMEKLLGDTYGVMIYQEDVIKVAHGMAGLSLGEADLLRRAMSGKGRSPEAMQKLKDQFLRGAKIRGVNDLVALEVWRQIESFAGYAFCKAHSASFAVLSYQVAYLKAHHPAEFMAAVLSNQGGYYGPAAYIEEARRLGLRILPPDINESIREFQGRDREIRIGLMAVGNLTEMSIQSILEDRENHGQYGSLGEFQRRVKLDPNQTELLIKCGAMDCFKDREHPTRPTLLWQSRMVSRLGHPATTERRDLPTLFDRTDFLATPSFPEYDSMEQFHIEKDIFGFPVTMHPLDFLDPKQRRGIVSSVDLEANRGKRVRMIGWAITSKRIKTRKTQAYMKFLTLEDAAGTFEVTLFPAVYHQYAHVTLDKGPYLVTGTIEEDHGVLSLVGKHIEPLQIQPLQGFGKDRRRRRDSLSRLRNRQHEPFMGNRAIPA